MDVTKRALAQYVNKAQDLAESIKRNIVKDGIVDDKTILALNAFIIASNAISDLQEDLKLTNMKLN